MIRSSAGDSVAIDSSWIRERSCEAFGGEELRKPSDSVHGIVRSDTGLEAVVFSDLSISLIVTSNPEAVDDVLVVSIDFISLLVRGKVSSIVENLVVSVLRRGLGNEDDGISCSIGLDDCKKSVIDCCCSFQSWPIWTRSSSKYKAFFNEREISFEVRNGST